MEPVARTVASGSEWPMRSGGAWTGSLWAPTGRPRLRRHPIGPYRGGRGLVPACRRGNSGGQLGGPLGSPLGIYTGGFSTAGACPVPHAIRSPDCVAQLGTLRWSALAHLLTSRSSVYRAPSVVRQGCHSLALAGWGSLRFGAHGGLGSGVGLIATEESDARLVYRRLTLGSAGRAWGSWFGGGRGVGAAMAKVFRPTRRAGGKDKAKMAGGVNDVQMADAACAARSGAHGAGSPAGRAGSEASVGSGSRRDGSSADHGRDMRGGDYPDGAEDRDAEPPLIEEAGPSPFRRTYSRVPSLGTRDGVPVMSDDVLVDAATNNSRVALVRIEQSHWCGGNPLSGVTRPPGMSRGRVVSSHATPP